VKEDEFRALLQLNVGELWWRRTVGFGSATETVTSLMFILFMTSPSFSNQD
jgi:hypothetical protein